MAMSMNSWRHSCIALPVIGLWASQKVGMPSRAVSHGLAGVAVIVAVLSTIVAKQVS